MSIVSIGFFQVSRFANSFHSTLSLVTFDARVTINFMRSNEREIIFIPSRNVVAT